MSSVSIAALIFLASEAFAATSMFRSRGLAVTNLPDPYCKTGTLSLAGTPTADGPQVCCAGYCGECSDYPTCKSVRGQDSENACCASKVLEMSCDEGAPANVCLKSCTEAVPPCIMPKGEKFEMPAESSAAEDCEKAVDDFMTQAQSAVEGAADDGADIWKGLEDKGVALTQKRFLVNKQNHTAPCHPRKNPKNQQ